MPGVRDKNLRSGDLHEELGLFLLRALALVAPVPRQEDVGNDAFATLIRPEGGRRLIPDLSFLVQLKASSVTSVKYSTSEAIAWLRSLDTPLFIGRVFLKEAKIELFSTQRVHQLMLEKDYESIELLLDTEGETSQEPKSRRANLGSPVHAWSVPDVTEPDFLVTSFAVLHPHVENWRQNLLLRGIQSHRILQWETGQPPTGNGEMMLVSPDSNISSTLEKITPHVRRLLIELQYRKRYADFPVMLAFMDLMTRWGVDPDPDGWVRMMVGSMAEGPEIQMEDVIRIRYAFQPDGLDLSRLPVTDEALGVIPDNVTGLGLVDTPITDAGVAQLLRLAGLKRLNLAGTQITDNGLVSLKDLAKLEWVCVNRTRVTAEGVNRLEATRPEITILIDSEP